jgi:folate-binding protein YgfZ
MITTALPDFERLHLLRGGAMVAGAPAAVFRIAGAGALTCLQGLWTNDLVEPGEASFTYGALLTPKGMIISDGWALRSGEAVDLIFPPQARDAVDQIFRRSLPPRLATAADLSDSLGVVHLLGDGAADRWPVVPLGRLPEAGQVSRCEVAGGELLAATPVAGPFEALLIGPVEAITGAEALLKVAGMKAGDDADREAARILAGWPALGAEIDERTLPQEVRFDEHAGVSYTKGCYTGQETVARLHFRGHANRILRGLRWIGPPADGEEIRAGEKPVGRVASVLRLPDRTLGLALLRREVHPGNRVTIGGCPAVVRELPFGPGDIEG